MNMKQWARSLIGMQPKKGFPVLSFPSISLMGITVKDLIASEEAQAEGMARIAARTPSLASVSMMDLSVEAEAFGATARFSDGEVPTIVGKLLNDESDADALAVPAVGAGRTGRYIRAVKKAKERITDRPVLAGVIGPFSLAGRLMGVSEALVNCYDEPDFLHTTLQKATEFLTRYILAYREAGADGVVMAEPLAGLLSPRLVAEFSCDYVREIIDQVQTDDFIVIYHNCGDNVSKQFADIMAVGAAAYHVGNAIDIRALMETVPPEVIVMGNISPAAEFLQGTPESMRSSVLALMNDLGQKYPNFIISSGCDIPPLTPWANIDAFYRAIDEYNERGKSQCD